MTDSFVKLLRNGLACLLKQEKVYTHQPLQIHHSKEIISIAQSLATPASHTKCRTERALQTWSLKQ